MSVASSNADRRKTLTCPVCGKNFEDQSTLDTHKKMDHSSESQPPADVG